MRFISYLQDEHETWGVLVGGGVVELAKRLGHPTLLDFIASEDYARRDDLVRNWQVEKDIAEVTLLPVIPRPEKIVCAVRNYMDHHHEALKAGLKRELSEFPPIFLRVWRSQVAHGQPIIRPKVSDSLDWEGELAVIIGKSGRDITEQAAENHIAGYSIYNDASVRDWQFHAKQIAAGKNFEGTGSFGPWMVTADELPLDRSLKLETRLNGEVMQSGQTSDMIFSVAQLIAYASTIFTLVPGDVIVTGTPAGVGFTRSPPRFMKPGDSIEVTIEGIGTLRNPIAQQS